MEVLERLGNCGVVPVVVIDDAKDGIPTAKALVDGGIDVMEVTLRTGAALDAILQVAKSYPEICVGAGTVLLPVQALSSLCLPALTKNLFGGA